VGQPRTLFGDPRAVGGTGGVGQPQHYGPQTVGTTAGAEASNTGVGWLWHALHVTPRSTPVNAGQRRPAWSAQ
jgi:hypothetical protein